MSMIFLKLIFALIFVISLIILSAYLGSKLKDKNFFKTTLQNAKSIIIVESRFIDNKQKLILIKVNNTQYLILVSPAGNLLLDKIEINKNPT